MDFPGGTVDRNSPTKAGVWVQSLVWKDSTCCEAAKACATQRLSLSASTTEARLEPVLRNKRNPRTATREQPPLSATREACTQQQRRGSQK